MLKLQSQGSPSCLWFASGFILIYINICEALLMSQEADLSTRITLLENLLPPTLPFRFIRSGICVWSFPTVDKKHEEKHIAINYRGKHEQPSTGRLGKTNNPFQKPTIFICLLQSQLKADCRAFVLH